MHRMIITSVSPVALLMFSEYVLLQKLYAKKTNAKVDSHRFPTEKPIAQVVLFETFLTKN